jgi:hypothetical protein
MFFQMVFADRHSAPALLDHELQATESRERECGGDEVAEQPPTLGRTRKVVAVPSALRSRVRPLVGEQLEKERMFQAALEALKPN